MPMSICGISTSFLRHYPAALKVLSDIDLEVRDSEIVANLGPSGCGKTTLLKVIAGLERPDSGEITIDGRPVKRPGMDRGLIFQDGALFPWRTVVGNIGYGLDIRCIKGSDRDTRVRSLVKLVGLQGFEGRFPHELSGGVRQRVALARALANEPRVLLMDEPLGALDPQTRRLMQREILRVWRETRGTFVLVTHNVGESVLLADRVILLSPRPASITAGIPIDLPRPRHSGDPAVMALKEELLGLLDSNFAGELEIKEI